MIPPKVRATLLLALKESDILACGNDTYSNLDPEDANAARRWLAQADDEDELRVRIDQLEMTIRAAADHVVFSDVDRWAVREELLETLGSGTPAEPPVPVPSKIEP